MENKEIERIINELEDPINLRAKRYTANMLWNKVYAKFLIQKTTDPESKHLLMALNEKGIEVNAFNYKNNLDINKK